MVTVYPLLLFGGCAISIDLDQGDFIVSVDDGWIRFKAANHEVSFRFLKFHNALLSLPSKVAELVRDLRLELDQLLQDKIETPSIDLCTCPHGSQIIDTIVQLITTQ
jgi:ATP-dependent RNA helicase DHX57